MPVVVILSTLLIPAKVRAGGPEPSSGRTAFWPFDPSFKADQLRKRNLENVSLPVGEKEITIVHDSVEASGDGERGQVSEIILNGVEVVVKIELI
jgi:hypothetical protein